MELKGKRIAILVDQAYQEMEIWYPLYRFREAGAEVVTVGAKAGATYPSKLGYPCVADKSYDEVSAADFDGLVAPGGYAPDHIRRHPKATNSSLTSTRRANSSPPSAMAVGASAPRTAC